MSLFTAKEHKNIFNGIFIRKHIYNMKNQVISLTEQDLQFIVEDAVKNYLISEGIDEISLGGLSALGSKFGNSMSRMGRTAIDSTGRAVNNLGSRINTMGQRVGNAYRNAKDSARQTYNSAKETYQVGAINQEAQKAVNNAKMALEKLQQLNQQLMSMGQATVLNKNTAPMVQNLLNNLSRIGGGFQGRRTMQTR